MPTVHGMNTVCLCLLRRFSVFTPVTFVLFILVFKTIIRIQTSIASARVSMLVDLSLHESFPPRRNISSHLLLHWLKPFFVCVQPEVRSTVYPTNLVWKLFRPEPGTYCGFQPVHPYFLPRETKVWRKWKEEGDVIVVEPTLWN